MDVDISPCNDSEFDTAVTLMDDEFIASRGRSGSVRERFPTAILRSAHENIAVARVDGLIASVLAVRPFTLGDQSPAAMIGLVCTRPQYRGLGLASSLLKAVGLRLKSEGNRLAVLWSNLPAFYARLGWISADVGCIASAEGIGNSSRARPINDAAIARAAVVRERWEPNAIHRSTGAWRTIPPHADSLEIFLEEEGYVLAGTRGDEGFIYEICGAPSAWPALWNNVRQRYRKMTVNGRKTGDCESWLASRYKLRWTTRSLALWLPLHDAPPKQEFSRLYVPIPDRI